jgi:hypothetical protein
MHFLDGELWQLSHSSRGLVKEWKTGVMGQFGFRALAIGMGLWETVGMGYNDRARPKGEHKGTTVPRRTPAKGDKVTPNGHRGAFLVTEIDSAKKMANLTKIGSPDSKLVVGWRDVSFLEEPDEGENTPS